MRKNTKLGDVMAVNFMDDAPQIIKDFLMYKQNVQGRSSKTVDEYYIDLRTFFRYINFICFLIDLFESHFRLLWNFIFIS